MSPELSRTHSQSRLQFRSPEASEYSDATDPNVQGSWSPPAWRKAGSGWFKHHDGLASPMRSREASPLKDDEEDDEDQDMDITAAAEIPLPGSPVKGRSISRSMSPERRHDSPMAMGGKDRSNGRQGSEDRNDNSKNCMFITCLGYSIVLTIAPRHSLFRTSRRATPHRTH